MAYLVQRSKNLLNLNRTQATYDGKSSNTAIRSLSENYYYVGLAGTNYWSPKYIEQYLVADNKVQLKANETGFGIAFPVKCYPNTEYTISFIGENTYTTVGLYKETGEFIRVEHNRTFVTPENCYWLVICFRNLDLTKEATYTYIMLNEGEVALPYEPYGARIFIGNNLIPFPYNGTCYRNGITYKVNNDGSIHVKGTVVNEPYQFFLVDRNIHLKVGVSYTLSGGKGKIIVAARKIDTSGNDVWWIETGYATGKLNEGEDIGRIFIYIPVGAVVDDIIYPMFNEGSTALPYEPYRADPYAKIRIAYYNGKKIFLDRTRFGISGSSKLANLGKFRLYDLRNMKLR